MPESKKSGDKTVVREVRLPERLAAYCKSKGITVQSFLDVAVQRQLFDMVYKDITS